MAPAASRRKPRNQRRISLIGLRAGKLTLPERSYGQRIDDACHMAVLVKVCCELLAPTPGGLKARVNAFNVTVT